MGRVSVLKSKFFNRDTVEVARDLLGKVLVRKVGDKTISLVVNEAEAYDGFEDKASHAHKGKTPRNSLMFGHAGYYYIYLIYGFHWMLNITTGPKGYPAAVLICGGFTEDGKNIDGPGKLTKYLKIDKSLNGLNIKKENSLWFEDRGGKVNPKKIIASPRIGVAYAGPVWSKKKLRFVWNGVESTKD